MVSFRPPESVAVRRISRWVGYSWAGAVNDPVVPVTVVTVCSWQFSGQWCTTSVHDSAEPPSVPCWGSVAEPEKPMTLPACHVTAPVGVVMVAVGRELPAVMTTVAVSVALCGSVTRSFTL